MMLKMQKLAVLSILRVCDSLCKKNIKPEIAIVGAGRDSRPKGRFSWCKVEVILPENPMDRGAWLGYSPWGPKESDMTERCHFHSGRATA